MKKLVLIGMIGVIAVMLISIAGAAESSNTNEEQMKNTFSDDATRMVIADTTHSKDIESFKSKGCSVRHFLKDATALRCPTDVVSSLAVREDEIFYIVDAGANSQINADDVWALGYTGTGVNVAVLDTGVDYMHPELSSGITGGASFVTYTTSYLDDNGHGTHVSGIITADGVGGTPAGYAKGVAPNAKVWMAKVCDAGGSCYSSDIAAAIEYVVGGPDGAPNTGDEPAKIMSISLGGGGTSGTNCDTDYLASKVNWAVNNGVTVVAAAGNTAGTVSSPGCASGAIAVGAVDKNNVRASWSGTGLALDIMAPGVSIYSTTPSNSYASWSGTSMATPHVAAVAALLKQVSPALNDTRIKNALYNTAVNLGLSARLQGHGRIDALAAVNYVVPPVPVNDTIPPVVTLQSPADGATDTDGAVTFKYIPNDADSGIVSCQLTINDVVDQISTSIAEGAINQFEKTGMANGVYVWNIKCTDSSSNANEGSGIARTLNINIDTEAPAITNATGNTQGTTGEHATIKATITDNVGVDSAAVFYTPISGGGTTYWRDDFNDLGNWIKTGTDTMEIVNGSLHILTTSNMAQLISNNIMAGFDTTNDYTVKIRTKIAKSSHWLFFMYNKDVNLVYDITTLSCRYGDTNYQIAPITIGQWYEIQANVHPSSNTYDVYVNGVLMKTCGLPTDRPDDEFLIGDFEAGTANYGEMYFDYFEVSATTTSLPSVPMIKGTDNVWSADVPMASNKVGTVTYYIIAKDAANNAAKDPIEGTYGINVIDNDAPLAAAGPDQSVWIGKTVAFDGSASTDNVGIISYGWNFGDGTTGTGMAVTHTYNVTGTYTATLTVNDDAGNSASDTALVTVKEVPVIVTEFYDSFEVSEWNALWVEDAQNDWFRSDQRATEGSRSAEVDGNAIGATLTMANAIDLRGKTSATLTFSWFIESSWDGGEYICLDMYYNGAWHNGVPKTDSCIDGASNTGPEENRWLNVNTDLTNYMTGNFKIRFRAKVSSFEEDGNIDKVTITSKY